MIVVQEDHEHTHVVSRRFGFHRLELCEDAAQTALLQATRSWSARLPENPEAWLYRVAHNHVLDELREIVKRWVAEAPTGPSRRMYENFGARMIELKQALAEAPTQPTREELEQALTMMLRLAAQQTSGASPPRK